MKLNFNKNFNIYSIVKFSFYFIFLLAISVYALILVSFLFYTYSAVPYWDELDFVLYAYERIANGDLIHLLYGHGSFDQFHQPIGNRHSAYFVKWLGLLDIYLFGGQGYLPSLTTIVSILILLYFFYNLINKLNIKNIIFPLSFCVILLLGYHNYFLYLELSTTTSSIVFLFALLSFYYNYLSFEETKINFKYFNLCLIFSICSILSFTNGMYVFPIILIQTIFYLYINTKYLNFNTEEFKKLFIIIFLFLFLYIILMSFLIPHLNSKEITTFNNDFFYIHQVFINLLALPFKLSLEGFVNVVPVGKYVIKNYIILKKYIPIIFTYLFLALYFYKVYDHFKNFFQKKYFDKFNFFIFISIFYILLVVISISLTRSVSDNTGYGYFVSLLWILLFFLYLRRDNILIAKHKRFSNILVFMLLIIFLPHQTYYLNNYFLSIKLDRNLAALALKNNIYDEKKLASIYPTAPEAVTRTSFFVKNNLSVWSNNKKYLDIKDHQNFFNYNCSNVYELPRDTKIEKIKDLKEWSRISGNVLLDKHSRLLIIDSNKKITGQVFLRNENFLDKFKNFFFFKSKQKTNYYFEGYLLISSLSDLTHFRLCSIKN